MIQKLIRHPLSWLISLLLILFFAFIVFPVAIDSGEEKEAEAAADETRREDIATPLSIAKEDSLMVPAPEPVDKTEEVLDTLPEKSLK